MGQNRILLSSMDHERVLPWLDSYWSEEVGDPGYVNGRLLSKIRSYKVGEQYRAQMFAYTGVDSPSAGDRGGKRRTDPRLALAEAMAFNRQCLGDIGSPLWYRDFPASGRRYIRFFWDNFDLFAKSSSAAEVAVLRGFSSMAFNNFLSHQQVGLAEQALIQAQIPFDIIEDHNLTNLTRYKVLVLANQESLSDIEIQEISQFVKQGGGVVATASTAPYDSWRRQRATNGLKDLFASRVETGVSQNVFGRGRAVYIPVLTPSIPIPPRTAFVSTYWAAPLNSQLFIRAIDWTARDNLTFHIVAPASVTSALYYEPTQNASVHNPGCSIRIELYAGYGPAR